MRLCVLLGVIALVVPFEKKVSRVIINTDGMILEFRKGNEVRYLCNQYVSCEGNFLLYFEERGGKCKKLKFNFLCRDDIELVQRDLNSLKLTGKLYTPNTSIVDEEAKLADQQFLEEKQKLYADAERYKQYLNEEENRRLSASQKQDLVRMIKNGTKLDAIKRCREWTGLPLKEAKDLMDRYQKELMDQQEKEILGLGGKDVTARQEKEILESDKKEQLSLQQEESEDQTAPSLTAPEIITEQPKSEAELREIEKKLGEEIEQWKETHGNKGSIPWKWIVTGKEREVAEQRSLEGVMDQFLSDLSMRREDSVALIPPAPISGIACVRACLDPHGIMYHVEVEYAEHDEQGKPKILYKDGLMSWDVRDIFVTFKRYARVETNGWNHG